MVPPNRAEASRNLPLLVRYGPIITNASMVRKVGRFIKELSLRHCIAAATDGVNHQHPTGSGTGELTVDVSLLRLTVDAAGDPSFSASVIDAVL